MRNKGDNSGCVWTIICFVLFITFLAFSSAVEAIGAGTVILSALTIAAILTICIMSQRYFDRKSAAEKPSETDAQDIQDADEPQDQTERGELDEQLKDARAKQQRQIAKVESLRAQLAAKEKGDESAQRELNKRLKDIRAKQIRLIEENLRAERAKKEKSAEGAKPPQPDNFTPNLYSSSPQPASEAEEHKSAAAIETAETAQTPPTLMGSYEPHLYSSNPASESEAENWQLAMVNRLLADAQAKRLQKAVQVNELRAKLTAAERAERARAYAKRYPKTEPLGKGDRFYKHLSIAGSKYCDQRSVNALKTGSVIQFAPEPENKYDPNAIRVFNKHGKPVGYIRRGDNVEILKLLAQGKRFYGIITTARPEASYISFDMWSRG